MDLKTTIIVLGILFIHWFADFVLQTDEQAKGKSKNWLPLLEHTLAYSLCFYVAVPFWAMNSPDYVEWTGSLFVLITFVSHTITDYFTSRLNAKLWKDQRTHAFFVSVGFDQLLHFTQLLLTFYFLGL